MQHLAGRIESLGFLLLSSITETYVKYTITQETYVSTQYRL